MKTISDVRPFVPVSVAPILSDAYNVQPGDTVHVLRHTSAEGKTTFYASTTQPQRRTLSAYNNSRLEYEGAAIVTARLGNAPGTMSLSVEIGGA